MQNQQDIQNVKIWQTPELIELGDIANDTQFSPGAPGADTVTTGS
jgi:hypothetical protein